MNGAPSRKGCVFNAMVWSSDKGKQQMSTPPPPPQCPISRINTSIQEENYAAVHKVL